MQSEAKKEEGSRKRPAESAGRQSSKAQKTEKSQKSKRAPIAFKPRDSDGSQLTENGQTGASGELRRSGSQSEKRSVFERLHGGAAKVCSQSRATTPWHGIPPGIMKPLIATGARHLPVDVCAALRVIWNETTACLRACKALHCLLWLRLHPAFLPCQQGACHQSAADARRAACRRQARPGGRRHPGRQPPARCSSQASSGRSPRARQSRCSLRQVMPSFTPLRTLAACCTLSSLSSGSTTPNPLLALHTASEDPSVPCRSGPRILDAKDQGQGLCCLCLRRGGRGYQECCVWHRVACGQWKLSTAKVSPLPSGLLPSEHPGLVQGHCAAASPSLPAAYHQPICCGK